MKTKKFVVKKRGAEAGAEVAIHNFGSGSERQFNFGSSALRSGTGSRIVLARELVFFFF